MTANMFYQRERRDKIRSVLENSTQVTNRDLIYLIDDPIERRRLNLTIMPAEFVEKVESHLERTLGRLVRLAVDIWGIDPNLNVVVNLNYRDTRRGISNAGTCSGKWRSQYTTVLNDEGPCININGIWATLEDRVFVEYAHIAPDPQIGSIRVSSWREYMEVLMAHEFAHILELETGIKTPLKQYPSYRQNNYRAISHRYQWQSIYRQLRLELGDVGIRSTEKSKIAAYIAKGANKCSVCNKPMIGQRSDAKYCGAKCRVQANRNAKTKKGKS